MNAIYTVWIDYLIYRYYDTNDNNQINLVE